jgi:hypothetical protein
MSIAGAPIPAIAVIFVMMVMQVDACRSHFAVCCVLIRLDRS